MARLFGLDVSRASSRELAPAPDGSPNAPTSGVYGGDAASPYAMFNVKPNENPELWGRAKFYVFDEMRWSDAMVKSSLWLYKLPIRSADWNLTPATKDGVDLLIADQIAHNFGLEDSAGVMRDGVMDLSWHEQLGQANLKLDYGAMFEEIIWGDTLEFWRDVEGQLRPIRPIQRLAPRFPATIRWPDGIHVDPMTGLIESLIQDVPGARPIPGDKLCWHTLDREGSDWYGTSMLRAMYGAWRLKRALMVASGIAWDRFGYGVPIVWYPRGGDKKREAENVARGFRAHEQAWVVFEGKRGDPNGWDIDIVHQAPHDSSHMIKLYDEQIATAAVQHFMVMGRTSGGNRALAESLGEPYYLAAQAIAEDTATDKKRILFRRFVDENFGPEYPTPKLIVSGIHNRNILELAQAVSNLADAGLTFTDPDTQNDIRETLDMRSLPLALQQAIENGDVGIEALPNSPLAIATGTSPAPSAPAGITPVPRGALPAATDFRPPSIAGLSEGDDLAV